MSDDPPSSSPPTRRHFCWLDWLRFLAAFLVLIDHTCQANWPGLEGNIELGLPFWMRWTLLPVRLGREAVIMFFVLSGALVGGLTLEKIRAGVFDARAYAADRLARVYVPLLPALLLSVAVLWASDRPVEAGRFVGCLFGLQGVTMHAPAVNVVLWTLAYEVWFYVLAGCAGGARGVAEMFPQGAWCGGGGRWVGAVGALPAARFDLSCLLADRNIRLRTA